MDPVLAELADAHGVATWFENSRRERQEIAPDVVRSVLGLLDVDASTPSAAAAALAEQKRRPATGTLILREGQPAPAGGAVTLEDGSAHTGGPLPLGYHTLVEGDVARALIVTPAALPAPPRAWGWMVQLYALHSASSWGMGDFADLAEVVRRAADDGAGFVLLNPLHAPVPGEHVPASPYSPSSRRFVNPLYLRVAEIEGYAAAKSTVDGLRPARTGDLIDYDGVWAAKRAALERLAPKEFAFDDPALRDYATYAALAERHGSDWRRWPEELRRPDSPAVARAREELTELVAFHGWLQSCAEEQLERADRAAADMGIGIVHDLAVGIDPGGADGWLLQDHLAQGVRIGAPPDAFNQLGQDWGLAAWRPDRLDAAGYAPYRDLLRSLFAHAKGLRVDHVAGLWRLWWVPPGGSALDGTYVRYDPAAMVGILALEARRAGAVVVGEDLGTVPPYVTEGLGERNMLGCSVLWFTREAADWDTFLPSAKWPVNSLATVSTHDLPTAPGFLTGEHVRVRDELGVLARPAAEEAAEARKDRDALVELLVTEGFLVDADAPDEEIVVAMHGFLAATPSRLVAIAPYDVIGEVRQPNLPGTVDEYPNWRIPLPVSLDALFDDPRVRRVVSVLRESR
ncbi:4-alpha-glucanotransferase [Virgisporangium aliadipatigenens]|uniref:4-alpha-glucanotransferase n=1 Tax=Virgisporangium aliadipatigenens TaxID=741659 RepID=A0A8J3YXV7_9ACTN|nr:4-alpha-glucanotransferase [Virgisporangium aliadipatigenens]GIJ51578.1 4-alpha-glucanotransferase [Virgisporangium aliadipatigenens]